MIKLSFSFKEKRNCVNKELSFKVEIAFIFLKNKKKWKRRRENLLRICLRGCFCISFDMVFFINWLLEKEKKKSENNYNLCKASKNAFHKFGNHSLMSIQYGPAFSYHLSCRVRIASSKNIKSLRTMSRFRMKQ